MDMPRSSLLGRLEAFLPEMEKANREADELAQEGKLEVIDKNLEVASPEDLREQVDGTDPEDDEEDDQSVEEELREDGGGSAVRPRIVQLDFALGDFDDTPIAKMEGEKEAAESDRALHATAVADCEDGDGADEGAEKGAIPSLILMPGARKEPAGEASTKKKPCKPLIEEL